MLDKHYAPRARLLLVTGEDVCARRKLQELVSEHQRQGVRVGLLLTQEDLGALIKEDGLIAADLGARADTDTVAHRLFAAMRSLDEAGAEVILARAIPEQGRGTAVNDRLRRAATAIIEAR
jgi:L-threonylcarbamoyladenylate synthase